MSRDLSQLKKIIPPDQAIANKAIARSLQQVKNIFDAPLDKLSVAVSGLETNSDLNLINSLDKPIPDSVKDFYTSQVGTGSGPNGQVLLTDIIGTAAGVVHNDELPVVTGLLQDLASAGKLNALTYDDGNPASASVLGVYTVMNYCLDGEYTTGTPPTTSVVIPSPQPGAGTYADIEEAFQALIPAAEAIIAAIANANPTEKARANQAYDNMANQMVREKQNQAHAGINFTELQGNSRSSIMNLAGNLHDLGRDDGQGGAADFLEKVADRTSLAGQAVIASMREGRNIRRLADASIQTDIILDNTAPIPVPKATLSSGAYSVAQAEQNKKI